MALPSIEALNGRWAIPNHVMFVSGPGGLVTAQIDNAYCSATITLAGAHVNSYKKNEQSDIFWMSPNSIYQLGTPIRGGIPLCWPWFGPHPSNPTLPMHGFARLLLWSVKSTQAFEDGATEVRLSLYDTPETRAMWPHAFEAELVVTCGQHFGIDLLVRNPGSQPFTYTAALHSYFLVSDVGQVVVKGLEDTDYLDKVDHFTRKHQLGDVKITGQTDRVYVDTERECVLRDAGLERAIHIQKTNSRTTVVWNPAEKGAQVPDIGLGNERHFLCVETANAADDVVEVPAGSERKLSAVMAVEQAS